MITAVVHLIESDAVLTEQILILVVGQLLDKTHRVGIVKKELIIQADFHGGADLKIYFPAFEIVGIEFQGDSVFQIKEEGVADGPGQL